MLLLVTPCVGVWIETLYTERQKELQNVTPCVGVWIETDISAYSGRIMFSHTLRGCVD